MVPHPKYRYLSIRKSLLDEIETETNDCVIYGMHLGVHGQRLSTSLLGVIPIVMSTVMIVAGRDDLSSLHEYGTEGKAHGTLRGGILTLPNK
jgi:hypothetical protein